MKIGYCKYYFKNRFIWDIERQFNGEVEEAEEEYVALAIEFDISECAELVEIFVNQFESLGDEEFCQLYIWAVEFMIVLNYKRETVKRKCIHQRIQVGVLTKEEFPGLDLYSLFIDKIQYLCYIEDERQSYEEQTFLYCRMVMMNDHFDCKYLKKIKELEYNNLIFYDYLRCKEEGVKLKHLDHFRNHIYKVYSIVFRAKRSK